MIPSIATALENTTVMTEGHKITCKSMHTKNITLTRTLEKIDIG
jgi:hypothetical protein